MPLITAAHWSDQTHFVFTFDVDILGTYLKMHQPCTIPPFFLRGTQMHQCHRLFDLSSLSVSKAAPHEVTLLREKSRRWKKMKATWTQCILHLVIFSRNDVDRLPPLPPRSAIRRMDVSMSAGIQARELHDWPSGWLIGQCSIVRSLKHSRPGFWRLGNGLDHPDERLEAWRLRGLPACGTLKIRAGSPLK